MSTKIYNGVRLHIDDVFAFSDLLRDRLDPVRDLADARLLARTALHQLDCLTIRWPEGDQGRNVAHQVRLAGWEHDDRQLELRNKGRVRDWAYNPNRFELSLGRDLETGIIVGYYFCENDELRDAFLSMPEVSDFHYQDQAGRPDEIPEPEWETRRLVWDRVIGSDAIVERMLNFSLRPDLDLLSTNAAIHALAIDLINAEPIEERAARMARHIAITRYLIHQKATDQEVYLSDISMMKTGPLAEAVASFLIPSFDPDTPLRSVAEHMSDDRFAELHQVINACWEGRSTR